MNTSENVDRGLLGACAVVWLAVIGVSVAAIVALVEMATGKAGDPSPASGTPWGLYVIIGVSAAIILGSIPLLLRARRAAQQEPTRRPPAPAPRAAETRAPSRGTDQPVIRREPTAAPGQPMEASTEKLRVFGSVADTAGRQAAASRRPAVPSPSEDVTDRVWRRFILAMATAMGAATLAVSVATYFMGVQQDGAAWGALTAAGVVTVLMPLIPWQVLRQLHSSIAVG
jgi:Protein of unknown function (DUF2561)